MPWPTKKLGEIAPFLRGSGLSKKDLVPSGAYKCILYGQLYTIYGPVIDNIASRTDKMGKMLSVVGDVLIPGTTTADEIGIAVASALNETGVILGGDINIIRTENKLLNSKFLAFLLSGPLKMQMAKYARGTNIIHLSGKDIAKIEVPIPPRQTQYRIVERLDTIRRAQELNDKQIALADELFQSLLNKELNSKGKNWAIKKLGEITKFKRGPFGGSLKKEIFVEHGYKVYEQSNVIYDNFKSGNYFITERKYKEMIDFAIRPRDLLISCSGTIGKIAIVPSNAQPGIINQALLKITPVNKFTSSVFLKCLLESPSLQARLTANTRGSAIRNVASVKEIKRIKVPLPSIVTQQKIVERLLAVREYKNKLLEQKQKLQELFESVLSKSFKGELVK